MRWSIARRPDELAFPGSARTGYDPGVTELLGDVPRTAMRVGRYEVLRRIAIGPTSELYLARLVGIEGFRKLVVLKWMRQDVDDAERAERMFVRAAKIAARLDHPNIVHTIDLGVAQRRHFVAMEYVHGETAARLLEGGRLPVDGACRIAIEVLAALAHAHACTDDEGAPLGIVHRNVAPRHLVVGHDGRVVLSDFGLARADAWEELTYTGEVRAELDAAAPEQLRGGAVDERTDLYATGALLRQLAGEGLPDAVEAAVCAAMQPDPQRRFSSAAQMRAALNAAAQAYGLDVGPEPLARLVRERCGVRPPPNGVADGWFWSAVTTPVVATASSAKVHTASRRRAVLVAACGVLVVGGIAFASWSGRATSHRVERLTPTSPMHIAFDAPATAASTPPPSDAAGPIAAAPARAAKSSEPRPPRRPSPRARRNATARELDALLPSPEVE